MKASSRARFQPQSRSDFRKSSRSMAYLQRLAWSRSTRDLLPAVRCVDRYIGHHADSALETVRRHHRTRSAVPRCRAVERRASAAVMQLPLSGQLRRVAQSVLGVFALRLCANLKGWDTNTNRQTNNGDGRSCSCPRLPRTIASGRVPDGKCHAVARQDGAPWRSLPEPVRLAVVRSDCVIGFPAGCIQRRRAHGQQEHVNSEALERDATGVCMGY